MGKNKIKNMYPLQAYLDIINLLCRLFDLLTSHTLEAEMDEDPYLLVEIDGIIEHYIDVLINSDGTRSILNKATLKDLYHLYNAVTNTKNYIFIESCKKGFSKKQSWLDFVDLVNKVNTLLKNAVKKYEATTEAWTIE